MNTVNGRSENKAELEPHILKIVVVVLGIDMAWASKSDLQRILDAYRVMALHARLISLGKTFCFLEADNEKL